MINNWLITGDCHRNFSRFNNYPKEIQKDSNSAVIILGDAGINWTLDEHDNQIKNNLKKRFSFRIYCVRGNHEARPQSIKDMHLVYDEDVNGEVYIQDKWSNIRYFKDWGIYTIDGLKIAIIGGAYSIDKKYRLQNGYRWFKDEKLNYTEKQKALKEFKGQKVDMVFTHTCPISMEPRDLFLPIVNQISVDKSMEMFLENIKNNINYTVWCFGHFHKDRIENPGIEQFFEGTELLKDVWERHLRLRS